MVGPAVSLAAETADRTMTPDDWNHFLEQEQPWHCNR